MAGGRNGFGANAHLSGLNQVNHAGFNRNAFGDAQAWNRWGGRFWRAGGSNWGGWAGPVFWPFLYGDIFSFAFWPYDYYDPFWSFGPDVLFDDIFAPGPYWGSGYGYGGAADIYYGSNAAPGGRMALAQNAAAAAQSCSGLAPGVTTLPIAQIRNGVRPTADQAAALDDLSAAVFKASDLIKASCPSEIPLTPLSRLDAAEKRLDALLQAVQLVREPLEKFYDSLTDEQKHRFDAIGRTGRAKAAPGQAAAGGNLAALCGQAQQAPNVADLPARRIEQVVKPNAQQQDAFDDLKKAAQSAADELQASCPSQMPQTPVERLDAVAKRLSAMVAAMQTVRPKLADFYASLDDEQKAKFNVMGPPAPNASAPPADERSDK